MRLLYRCGRTVKSLMYAEHSDRHPTFNGFQCLPREATAKFARVLLTAVRTIPSLEFLAVRVSLDRDEISELFELLPAASLKHLYLERCWSSSAEGSDQTLSTSLSHVMEGKMLRRLHSLEKFTALSDANRTGVTYECMPESLRSITIGHNECKLSTSQLRQIITNCPNLGEINMRMCIEEGRSDTMAQSDLDFFCSHATR